MTRTEAAANARSHKTVQHGRTHTREFKSWQCMKERCHNPNSDQYPRYGAVGITVCPQWRNSFAAFFADMGACPSGKTIDRIENSKGYEPGNCRWADTVTQALNRKVTVWITAFGETLTRYEWARRLGVHYTVIAARLRHGWSPENAVTMTKWESRRKRI